MSFQPHLGSGRTVGRIWVRRSARSGFKKERMVGRIWVQEAGSLAACEIWRAWVSRQEIRPDLTWVSWQEIQDLAEREIRLDFSIHAGRPWVSGQIQSEIRPASEGRERVCRRDVGLVKGRVFLSLFKMSCQFVNFSLKKCKYL